MIPSGLVNPKCISIIGNGVVVHIPSLFSELKNLEKKGNLFYRENQINKKKKRKRKKKLNELNIQFNVISLNNFLWNRNRLERSTFSFWSCSHCFWLSSNCWWFKRRWKRKRYVKFLFFLFFSFHFIRLLFLLRSFFKKKKTNFLLELEQLVKVLDQLIAQKQVVLDFEFTISKTLKNFLKNTK